MVPTILRIALLIGVLPFLLAADAITETKVTPNPNGLKQVVEGEGTFTVDPAHTFLFVRFFATLTTTKPPQSTTKQATVDQTVNPNTWKATNLQVVAGNYDCFGQLTTQDAGGAFIITKSNVINVNVQ